MTECDIFNVKLSHAELDKLKSSIKNETEVFLRLSSNMIGNSNDETNFPPKLLFRQVENLRKAFANNSSANIKLSKTQLSKIVQSRRFLDILSSPLLKARLPLTENVINPLAKSVLIPLGLTAAASVADAGIRKKILGSGTTKLIISNVEMKEL